MSIEIKSYTEEQMWRLTQFQRAAGFIGILREQKGLLGRNGVVILPSGDGVGRGVDKLEARVMIGAFYGMFEECLDLGLKEEVITCQK